MTRNIRITLALLLTLVVATAACQSPATKLNFECKTRDGLQVLVISNTSWSGNSICYFKAPRISIQGVPEITESFRDEEFPCGDRVSPTWERNLWDVLVDNSTKSGEVLQNQIDKVFVLDSFDLRILVKDLDGGIQWSGEKKGIKCSDGRLLYKK